MATQIILKKSTTPGAIPLVGDLAQGELAVNVADRKLYTNNGSAIVSLGIYVNATAPSSPIEGDLWYDTATDSLKSYDGSAWSGGAASALSALTDVTVTALTDGEVLVSASGVWINQTLAEAGIAAATHTHAASDITSGTLADARVAASNVTQHQATLSITESQISDLGTYLTAEADTLDSVTDRGATTTNNVTVGNLDATDGDFAGNVIVTGNLTVNGTTTTVNTTEVAIGDNIIVLNSDEAGTPSQNAGFEVERGTSANVSFVWNETSDSWDFDGEAVSNVVVDGGTY